MVRAVSTRWPKFARSESLRGGAAVAGLLRLAAPVVGRRAKHEDEDAEVLVHPCLLVRVAASGVLGRLRLDRGFDPQPGSAEDVQN